MRSVLFITTLLALTSLVSGTPASAQSADADAQSASADGAGEETAEQAAETAERTRRESSDVSGSVANRQAAAQAYDRAANYYVGGNYAAAGQWFMTAYRLAPARAALVQAIRSYRRAERIERAGTLALLLAQSFPDDGPAVQLASEVMDEAGRASAHVTVECEGCTVSVDGRLLATLGAYVTADEDHTVVAHFGEQTVERPARGEAGSQVVLEIETPEGATVEDTSAEEAEYLRRQREEANDPGARVIPPAVFYVAAGLTLAAGAVTIWSGVDTLSGVDAYETMPTRAAYDAGQDKERRTNLLIGVTAGLAAVTVVVGALANFRGLGGPLEDEEPAPVEVGFGASPDGGMVVLRGAL